MNKMDKEQILYAMLKGIELEENYKGNFITAVNEWIKDPEDIHMWMNSLDSALNINQARKDGLYFESN